MTKTFVPFFRRSRAAALAVLIALGAALPPTTSAAQGLFAPVMQINGKVITVYELQQRALFYKLLNAPGVPEETAREQLITERLQVAEAEKLGIGLTPEQLVAGEEEFVQRVNLDRQTFLNALAQGGVEEGTFRDFVSAGLLWREVVKRKFQARVQVSDADIDNELRAEKPGTGNMRLLYSEIILPADSPAARDEALRRAAEIKNFTSFDSFSRAARAFSAAPSAARGGRVDWVEAKNMAPGLVQVLISMGPGQVSDPLPIPNAIALLQLRQIDDGVPPPPDPLTVEYMIYHIAGGRSAKALAEAGQVMARAQTCGELFEWNRKHGGDAARLEHATQGLGEVPQDVALELAHMDPGEYSTGLIRGGNLALLMLCARQQVLPEGTDRDAIRTRLQNRQLSTYAEAYLAELRDSAVIKEP